MAQYIDKDALIAEIRKYKNNAEAYLKYHHNRNDKLVHSFEQEKLVMSELLSFLDTLEVKEIDLEKELESWRHNHFHGRRDKEASGEYLERVSQLNLAKYFFELGMSVSNPTTAADRGIVEEIIFTLNTLGEEKMISYDKEIEWLRNKVKKIE